MLACYSHYCGQTCGRPQLTSRERLHAIKTSGDQSPRDKARKKPEVAVTGTLRAPNG